MRKQPKWRTLLARRAAGRRLRAEQREQEQREQEQREQEQRERATQWAEEQAKMRAEDARYGLD